MSLRLRPLPTAGLLFPFLAVLTIATAREEPPALVALIGITREIAPVEARLEGSRTETVHGFTFTFGSVDGRPIVAARAGVGKVNAAITATLLIDHFSPGAVLFTGTAGAVDPALNPGDIVIGTGVGHHDVGTVTAERFVRTPSRSPVSGRPDPPFFPADPALLAAARRAASSYRPLGLPGLERGPSPTIREGLIVTGDAFVASRSLRDEVRRELNAIAVEMEGAGVAQVCARFGIPFLVIRSITDRADGEAEGNYQRFVDAASRSAAGLALATVREMNVLQPAAAAK
jgi:adenosylhomocysteine nucleosidase